MCFTLCFTLSYVKVLVGVLYFLKRCALLSQSMCLFVDYNHSRGPVLNDFLYKAPSASVVGGVNQEIKNPVLYIMFP